MFYRSARVISRSSSFAREFGWPHVCRPQNGDDFTCDAWAAEGAAAT